MPNMKVKNSGQENEKNEKKADVSCWNCFAVENCDKSLEPITLNKVREKHRKKLKLYSFLASELTKPKTVPLKQKVSEQYVIGKRIDENLSKRADFIENNAKSVVVIDCKNCEKEIGSKEITTSQIIPYNSDNPTSATSETILQDKFLNISQTTSPQPVKNIHATRMSNSDKNRSQDHLSDNHFSPKYQTEINKITVLEETTAPEYYTLVTIKEGTDTTTPDNMPFSKMKFGLLKKSALNDKPVMENVLSTVDPSNNVQKEVISVPKKLLFTDIHKQSTTKANDGSKINLVSKNSINQNRKKIDFNNKDYDNFEDTETTLKCTSYKATKKTESTIAGVQKDNDENVNINKIPIKVSNNKKTDGIEISKIPKEIAYSSNISNKMLFLKSKDEMGIYDKGDNTSSNGSESGYAGSSVTVQDLFEESETKTMKLGNIRKNLAQLQNNRNHSKHETYDTSLPIFSKSVDKTILKTSSLSSGINDTGKKTPLKSLRWSTLSDPLRCFNFEDEVYISDSVSPGHATLPRRSNSPLPHERDLDRDRFPLNRSGLQARSESMASVYSGAGEGMRGNVTVRGEVQFSLLYNYRLGALEVGVRRCRDLAPVDVKRNRSDPYVKVYLLPDKSKAGKRKTKVKKNTLNPVFEETLSFVQPLASLSSRTLWLSAWHADMFGRNDFLGEVTLSLADVVFDDPAPMWYKLHERTEQFDEHQGTRGDLIVGLKFEPDAAARGKGTLHVLVKEAKNLVATKPNGLADVFCKSYLLPERGRLAKQKTSVVRRSLNPRWEHTFTYRGLSLQELATRALELSLWDRDRLASNDFMGAVRLSLGTGTYMGANVNWMDSMGKEVSLWQTMMHRPNFWVEGSLPLRPQLNN